MRALNGAQGPQSSGQPHQLSGQLSSGQYAGQYTDQGNSQLSSSHSLGQYSDQGGVGHSTDQGGPFSGVLPSAAAAVQHSVGFGRGWGQARLEGEAVMLALDALERCVLHAHAAQQRRSQQQQQQGETGYNGVSEGTEKSEVTDAAPALEMLHELCSFVMMHCASDQSEQQPSQSQQQSAVPFAVTTTSDAPPLTSQGSAALSTCVVSATPSHSNSSPAAWLDCVRAPLLCRVLRTYAQLPGARRPIEMQRMWGPLLRLSCSPQEDVRRAVAQHLVSVEVCLDRNIACNAERGG